VRAPAAREEFPCQDGSTPPPFSSQPLPTAVALVLGAGIWYEELQWGHAPPAWRGLAAGAIDVAYAVSTLGVGVVVSLLLRVGSERRQSVGELCARVRAVREVSAPAA
jgi:hypothetical protein